ncbi:mas-related G-protein coupled receptor member H-like [Erythrolamprus reginae]|uniref:mas-related G-protein coupled receptor member H-like n=1 Tax=Erythrolamprus reginae TaxID=121349 RepID=UPI00396CD3E2
MDIASPSPFNDAAHINTTTSYKNISYDFSTSEELVFATVTMVLCVLGILGNGLVIWLLGSSFKRNTFPIYFLNLSVADFGFLTFELMIEIYWRFAYWSNNLHIDSNLLYEFFEMGRLIMYSTGQFLLTAISIDRCVSVHFPIWYRCHRPVHLSTILRAVIWAISIIHPSINFIIVAGTGYEWTYEWSSLYPFMINTVLCLPLMTISSVILLIKICFVSQRQRRRKLLTAVLLTLFFFLVSAFPLNTIHLILYYQNGISPKFLHYGYSLACINSSINPLIYYLLGRKKGETQRSIKDFIQRVFKEEENCTSQMETSEGSKI